MPNLLKELQEKRTELGNNIERMRRSFEENDGQWKDSEEESNWKRLNEDYHKTVDRIKDVRDVLGQAAKVRESQEHEIDDPGEGRGGKGGQDGQVTEETRSLALSAWCRSQMGYAISDEQRQACQAVGLNPNAPQLRIGTYPTLQYRELQASFRNRPRHLRQSSRMRAEARNLLLSSTGANLISQSFVQELEIAMLAYGGIREIAETMVTSTGEPMKWPTANDTSNTGELIGENADLASTASVDPTLSSLTWNAYKFSSKPVLVSYETLEDSQIDLPSVLGQMLGERLGRVTASYFTTGTGSSQPQGIVTGAAAGKTAASATAITFDELIQLEHSVDPAYWPDSAYGFHSNVLLAIKLLKDDNGQYLWRRGDTESIPDTVNGKPYVLLQNMASTIEADAVVAIFGQLSKYKIRRVNDIRLYRLSELYRENDNDGFIALVREDGRLLNAGTNPVKKLTMASS